MKKSNVKTVGLIMIITFAGKAMGLARQIMFGFYYGTGSIEAAAFNVADQIPKNFLDAIFASAISASFIPVFNEYYEKKGRDEAYRLSNNFFNIIFLFTALVTALGVVFSRQIAGWYASGYSPEAKLLTSNLLQILFPLLILSGLAFALTGVLQSLGEFNLPAAMSVVSNGIIIVYYIFFIDRFGVYGLSAAYLLGWLGQLLIQIPFLIKNKFKYRFIINFKDPGIRQIGALMLPVLVSTWIQPVNLMINSKVASSLFDGSGAGVNALNYANTFYSVISGVFIFSVANVVFPKLSKQSISGSEGEFDDTVYKTLHTLLFFLIPMTIGLVILAKPLIKLFFEISGGQFDAFSTEITGRALAMYSIGIVGLGLQTILSRGFYAIKDGITPLLTSACAILINLALSVLLAGSMDVGGIALASSVSINAVGVIMLIVMLKKGKKVFDRHLAVDVIKMSAAGVLMAVVVIVTKNAAGMLNDSFISRAITAAAPTFLGLCVYLAATYIIKLPEAEYIKAPLIWFNERRRK